MNEPEEKLKDNIHQKNGNLKLFFNKIANFKGITMAKGLKDRVSQREIFTSKYFRQGKIIQLKILQAKIESKDGWF